MHRQTAKFIIVAVVSTAAAGIFYARSSVPNIDPQSVSTPIRLGDRRAPEGIEGRVIDYEGQPIAGAKVFAESLNFESGRMPTALTDRQGSFTIKNLRNDTYRVYAEKKEEGYANPLSAFHFGDSGNIPLINVSGQTGIPEITIFVGPKAAKITGQIVDSLNNKTIRDAQIILRRVDNPAYSYSATTDSNGRFNILVPSEPFTVEVSADSYEKWFYKSANSIHPANALKLPPGRTKNLTIPLRPSK